MMNHRPLDRLRTLALTALLGGVAGYVDTFGFVALYGIFTAHVTGNIVVAAADITDRGGDGALVRLVLTPIFVAAVALSAVLVTRVRRRAPGWTLSALLLVQAVGLVAFTGLGSAYAPELRSGIEKPPVLLVASVGVMAMAVQNALMREALGTLVPTTVMTGNVTQLTLELTHLWLSRNEGVPQDARLASRQKALALAVSLAGFFVGAAGGAWGFVALGYRALIAPTLLVLALAFASFPRTATTKPASVPANEA